MRTSMHLRLMQKIYSQVCLFLDSWQVWSAVPLFSTQQRCVLLMNGSHFSKLTPLHHRVCNSCPHSKLGKALPALSEYCCCSLSCYLSATFGLLRLAEATGNKMQSWHLHLHIIA